MDFKWLKTAYQFDGEPSGGEGGTTETSGGESGAPSPADTTGGDTGTPPPEPTSSPPEGTPPAEEIKPVAMPDSTRNIFKGPPATETHYVPPEAGVSYPGPTPTTETPEAPPPKVDLPTQEEWDLDPGKAAQKFQQHHEWKLYQETKPLKDQLQDRKAREQYEGEAEFQRKSMMVQNAARECERAVEAFWAPTSILNRDADYRNNPEIQKHVADTINACVYRALEVADETADIGRLKDITNNPKFLHRILNFAKGEVKIPDPTIRPTAMPAGAQAPTVAGDDILDEDDMASLKESQKEGWGYTAEQLRAAKKAIGGA